MWTCPICGETGTGGRFCIECGFDLTTDMIAHPTVCALPASASAALQNARQRRLASKSSYSVQRDKIVDGHTRIGAAAPQPAFDPRAGSYAVPGDRIVEGQVRTTEVPNRRPEADRRSEYAVPGASVVDGQFRTAAPDRDQPASGGGQPQAGANPWFQQPGQPGQPQAGANPRAQQPGQPQAGAGPRTQQPGQTVRPMQNNQKSGVSFLRVIRILLGSFLAFCSLVCLLILVTGDSGGDAGFYIFAMILFGAGAWLLIRKPKPKQ